MKITKEFITKLIKEELNKTTIIKEQVEQQSEEPKEESIYNSKPGQVIMLKFDGATIKVQRQLNDLFKVVDGHESHKLKDGDFLKLNGDGVLKAGKTLSFSIIRQVPDITYQTPVIVNWQIIKN